MRWLVRYFGGQFRPKSKGSSKLTDDPGFEWFVDGGYKKMELFLLGVLPYLVIKKEQALIALSFIRLDGKTNPQMRASFHEQCIALNSGKSVTTNMSNMKKCGQCGHLLSSHTTIGCNERVCDAAGDIDYCSCSRR
jgi:hypothetical protein